MRHKFASADMRLIGLILQMWETHLRPFYGNMQMVWKDHWVQSWPQGLLLETRA
jgi:hypothetical protein